MEEKNKKQKKEELQSRRDFFKKVAKATLPVLGAIALSQVPILSQAKENEGEMGCDWGCQGGCMGSCGRACSFDCTNSCRGYCTGGCKGSCQSTCRGTCASSCSGYAY